MGRRSRTNASLCGLLAIMAAAVSLSGCTMCPDPYDYSGPVPNGSSPQNDFRARSNGILPIGAAPVPWPPIVKSSGADGRDDRQVAAHRHGKGERHGTPTLADPLVEAVVGDSGATPIEPTSVLVSVIEESPAKQLTADEPEASAAPEAPVEAPQLAETPGWRPRQAR